jgi:GDP-mannose 4,6-dehydratase
LLQGNLEAKRDWGHAREYVDAMWRMLQQAEPNDYVIVSGETHSVREFCESAFSMADLDYRDYVKVDEGFYRHAEVDLLVGNASKARRELGWEPSIRLQDLVREMSRKISGCTPDRVLPPQTVRRARISARGCWRSSVRMLFTEGDCAA